MKTLPPEATQGCIDLVAAVINPYTFTHDGLGKRRKPNTQRDREFKPTPLGREWLEVAEGILDMDLSDVVVKI